MDTSKVYNQIADTYAEENKNRIGVSDDIKNFASLLPQNAKVIDLGCGVGYDSRDLKNIRKDLCITGVDNSSEMLNKFQIIAKNIPYMKSDMLEVSFSENELDGVWFNAALLHLPKAQGKTLLREIFRWIKPGGILYLRTKQGAGEKIIPVKKYGREDLSRFFAFYKENEIKNILNEIGFSIVSIKYEERNEPWIIAVGKKPL